jgi:small subunit ribosomal protein S18
MPQRREKKGPSAKDRRPIKKKTSILDTDSIKWIDYKDVNLLRRFMSERAKIRARRVTGNDQQQQAAVARAIKLAREMALLPYSVRQVTQRSKGRRDRGDRGDRGELRLPSSTPTSASSPTPARDVPEELLDGAELLDGESEFLDTAAVVDGGAELESSVADVAAADPGNAGTGDGDTGDGA